MADDAMMTKGQIDHQSDSTGRVGTVTEHEIRALMMMTRSLALDLYRTIVRWHYFCTKAYVFSTCSYWLGKVVIGNLLSTLMVHTIYAIVSYGM